MYAQKFVIHTKVSKITVIISLFIWMKNLKMTVHFCSKMLRRARWWHSSKSSVHPSVCPRLSDDFLTHEHKNAISLKWCKIWTSLIRTLHTRFQLVPTSMTLDDFEGPKRHSCRNINVLWSLLGKNSMTVDPYYQRQHVGRWFLLLEI